MIREASLNEKYTAILDLHKMLEEKGIPHELRRLGYRLADLRTRCR